MNSLGTLAPESEINILKSFGAALHKFSFDTDIVTLYYPGCGTDMMRPLMIMDALAKRASTWKMALQDPSERLDPIIGMVQKITGIVSHKILKNTFESSAVLFCFKDRKLHIEFSRTDALASTSALDLYDVYFDRAFEIVRRKDEGFVKRISDKLRPGGLAITDMRFPQCDDLTELHVKFPDWGFYKNPALYQKV